VPEVRVFNPLDKMNLGKSVAEALLECEVDDLPPSTPFEGAGIYAIYYLGDFLAYAPITEKNDKGLYQQPIYIGEAIPPGARKGGYGLGVRAGKVLYNRLGQHAKSIEQSGNLNLDDVKCKYIVVDDIWIPLGENLLIEWFKPVWNVLVDGFGNHDPGKGRYNQARSPWDALHPGRPFADKCAPPKEDVEEILRKIADFHKQV
jgi:hypothetical protein